MPADIIDLTTARLIRDLNTVHARACVLNALTAHQRDACRRRRQAFPGSARNWTAFQRGSPTITAGANGLSANCAMRPRPWRAMTLTA